MPHINPPVSFVGLLRYIGFQELPEDVPGSYFHRWAEPDPQPQKEEPEPMPNPPAGPVTPATPPPAIPDVLTRLQQAFTQKAAADAEAPLKAVAVLQDELSRYSAAIKKNAEDKALAAMLAAVGQEPPPPVPLETASLRTSLLVLLDLVGGALPPFPQRGLPEPPPSGMIQTPQLLADSAESEEPQGYDEDEIRAVIQRVESLGGEQWRKMPIPRLTPLVQAYTAEIRYWQGVVSTTSAMHWQLGQMIKLLSAIRGEADLPEFIRGLAHHHTADWLKLANDAHERVARFDQDAETPIDPRKPAVNRDVKPEKPSRCFTWPELPNLRAIAAQKPILLIGGLPVPNKVASIRDRFGLDVVWVEVYRDTGVQAALSRVRAGKVGAVVVLEKFLGHTSSSSLIDACNSLGIPWAFGSNAGTASLERAFSTLDSKSAAA